MNRYTQNQMRNVAFSFIENKIKLFLNIIQKNIPGKIIVIYDEDERIAPNAATTLVQRGYDNLFILSGGK